MAVCKDVDSARKEAYEAQNLVLVHLVYNHKIKF